MPNVEAATFAKNDCGLRCSAVTETIGRETLWQKIRREDLESAFHIVARPDTIIQILQSRAEVSNDQSLP